MIPPIMPGSIGADCHQRPETAVPVAPIAPFSKGALPLLEGIRGIAQWRKIELSPVEDPDKVWSVVEKTATLDKFLNAFYSPQAWFDTEQTGDLMGQLRQYHMRTGKAFPYCQGVMGRGPTPVHRLIQIVYWGRADDRGQLHEATLFAGGSRSGNACFAYVSGSEGRLFVQDLRASSWGSYARMMPDGKGGMVDSGDTLIPRFPSPLMEYRSSTPDPVKTSALFTRFLDAVF